MVQLLIMIFPERTRWTRSLVTLLMASTGPALLSKFTKQLKYILPRQRRSLVANLRRAISTPFEKIHRFFKSRILHCLTFKLGYMALHTVGFVVLRSKGPTPSLCPNWPDLCAQAKEVRLRESG